MRYSVPVVKVIGTSRLCQPLNLAGLAIALQTYRGLYLLGAGASAPSVPLGRELAEGVLSIERSSFSLEPLVPDERAASLRALVPEKVILEPDDLWDREARSKISNSDYQLVPLLNIATAADQDDDPPSYLVFRLFPPSLILNYNHDRLAERFCGARHRVIAVHGSIGPEFRSKEFAAFIETLREFDSASIEIPGLIFVERENEGLIERLPLSLADIDVVVLVGYSFSRTGCTLQDWVTFEHLVALLRREPRPVIVVDPSRSDAAEAIEAATQSNRVYWAPVRWDAFSKALIRVVFQKMRMEDVGRELFRAECDR